MCEQFVVEVVQNLVQAAQVPAALSGDRDHIAAAVVGVRCPADEAALGQFVEDADQGCR
ncbi:hypothetical protein ABZ815_16445 [Nonomuraea sp. NPDC047529]|uniref:hypothetical protein n=1 Tax=Nonomuraea sp. NPDC047529 TaxID=3155623 RepID=UPI00340B35FF